MRLLVAVFRLISLVNLTIYVTSKRPNRVVIVGGGAAGYFSAIEAAQVLVSSKKSPPVEVVVLEASSKPLQKVLISGGGRCNVMHDPSKGAVEITRGYPRGQRELLSPFNAQFGPQDTYEWFSKQGVQMKTEYVCHYESILSHY